LALRCVMMILRAMSDGDPDTELVILLFIALVTVVCAAYTLLSATGVLGGG
jgi:hypothetical protein